MRVDDRFQLPRNALDEYKKKLSMIRITAVVCVSQENVFSDSSCSETGDFAAFADRKRAETLV
jgi:hypothetical protein